MSGSVVAVTLYAATLLAFGIGYAVVFFTGSLMLNYTFTHTRAKFATFSA